MYLFPIIIFFHQSFITSTALTFKSYTSCSSYTITAPYNVCDHLLWQRKQKPSLTQLYSTTRKNSHHLCFEKRKMKTNHNNKLLSWHTRRHRFHRYHSSSSSASASSSSSALTLNVFGIDDYFIHTVGNIMTGVGFGVGLIALLEANLKQSKSNRIIDVVEKSNNDGMTKSFNARKNNNTATTYEIISGQVVKKDTNDLFLCSLSIPLLMTSALFIYYGINIATTYLPNDNVVIIEATNNNNSNNNGVWDISGITISGYVTVIGFLAWLMSSNDDKKKDHNDSVIRNIQQQNVIRNTTSDDTISSTSSYYRNTLNHNNDNKKQEVSSTSSSSWKEYQQQLKTQSQQQKVLEEERIKESLPIPQQLPYSSTTVDYDDDKNRDDGIIKSNQSSNYNNCDNDNTDSFLIDNQPYNNYIWNTKSGSSGSSLSTHFLESLSSTQTEIIEIFDRSKDEEEGYSLLNPISIKKEEKIEIDQRGNRSNDIITNDWRLLDDSNLKEKSSIIQDRSELFVMDESEQFSNESKETSLQSSSIPNWTNGPRGEDRSTTLAQTNAFSLPSERKEEEEINNNSYDDYMRLREEEHLFNIVQDDDTSEQQQQLEMDVARTIRTDSNAYATEEILYSSFSNYELETDSIIPNEMSNNNQNNIINQVKVQQDELFSEDELFSLQQAEVDFLNLVPISSMESDIQNSMNYLSNRDSKSSPDDTFNYDRFSSVKPTVKPSDLIGSVFDNLSTSSSGYVLEETSRNVGTVLDNTIQDIRSDDISPTSVVLDWDPLQQPVSAPSTKITINDGNAITNNNNNPRLLSYLEAISPVDKKRRRKKNYAPTKSSMKNKSAKQRGYLMDLKTAMSIPTSYPKLVSFQLEEKSSDIAVLSGRSSLQQQEIEDEFIDYTSPMSYTKYLDDLAEDFRSDIIAAEEERLETYDVQKTTSEPFLPYYRKLQASKFSNSGYMNELIEGPMINPSSESLPSSQNTFENDSPSYLPSERSYKNADDTGTTPGNYLNTQPLIDTNSVGKEIDNKAMDDLGTKPASYLPFNKSYKTSTSFDLSENGYLNVLSQETRTERTSNSATSSSYPSSDSDSSIISQKTTDDLRLPTTSYSVTKTTTPTKQSYLPSKRNYKIVNSAGISSSGYLNTIASSDIPLVSLNPYFSNIRTTSSTDSVDLVAKPKGSSYMPFNKKFEALNLSGLGNNGFMNALNTGTKLDEESESLIWSQNAREINVPKQSYLPRERSYKSVDGTGMTKENYLNTLAVIDIALEMSDVSYLSKDVVAKYDDSKTKDFGKKPSSYLPYNKSYKTSRSFGISENGYMNTLEQKNKSVSASNLATSQPDELNQRTVSNSVTNTTPTKQSYLPSKRSYRIVRSTGMSDGGYLNALESEDIQVIKEQYVSDDKTTPNNDSGNIVTKPKGFSYMPFNKKFEALNLSSLGNSGYMSTLITSAKLDESSDPLMSSQNAHKIHFPKQSYLPSKRSYKSVDGTGMTKGNYLNKLAMVNTAIDNPPVSYPSNDVATKKANKTIGFGNKSTTFLPYKKLYTTTRSFGMTENGYMNTLERKAKSTLSSYLATSSSYLSDDRNITSSFEEKKQFNVPNGVKITDG